MCVFTRGFSRKMHLFDNLSYKSWWCFNVCLFFFACSHKDSLQKLLFLSKFDEQRIGLFNVFVPQIAVFLQSCFNLASVLLQSCFNLASVLLQSYSPIKLGFRGSYFLLLIGSRRPPRKKVPQASLGSCAVAVPRTDLRGHCLRCGTAAVAVPPHRLRLRSTT